MVLLFYTINDKSYKAKFIVLNIYKNFIKQNVYLFKLLNILQLKLSIVTVILFSFLSTNHLMVDSMTCSKVLNRNFMIKKVFIVKA